jgi:hypothetical protein
MLNIGKWSTDYRRLRRHRNRNRKVIRGCGKARGPACDAPEILVNAVGWSPKYDPDGNPWKPWTIPIDHWQPAGGVTPFHYITSKAAVLGLTKGVARDFLFSDMADYITRTAVEVNGGLYPGP